MEFILHTDMQKEMPRQIDFNFEALKGELAERLEHYKGLVITEDAIKEGKEDRAKLNKLRIAVDAKRKDVKKEFMAPYTDFEAKCKELLAMIEEPIKAIDTQLQEYENLKKAEKRTKIEEAYEELVDETIKPIIPLNRIFDQRWLNATVTMKKVEEAISDIVKRVNADLIALDTVEEEYQAAVKQKYIDTLDIAVALRHKKALQDAAEAFKRREAEKVEQTPTAPPKEAVKPQETARNTAPEALEEKKYTLRLEFKITQKEADALKRFLTQQNINYTKI